MTRNAVTAAYAELWFERGAWRGKWETSDIERAACSVARQYTWLCQPGSEQNAINLNFARYVLLEELEKKA